MIKTLPLQQVQSGRVGMLAEVVGVLTVLCAALAMRLVNLNATIGKFDEGIRGEQLLLMAAGFRPFRDIFASQGPLSLDVFYPTFMLFGQTLAAARLAPALLSVVGILIVAWTARLVAGPLAAAVAGVILSLSPTFLKNSRLALVEVPALVPACAAVGAALAYQLSGNRRWLVASGAVFALAVLIKPMVLPAAVPIVLAMLCRPKTTDDRRPTSRDSVVRRRSSVVGDLLAFGATAIALAAIVIAAVGPAQVYDQMVRFRMASRQVEGWSLTENWSAMAGELVDEGLVLYVAALAAGALLLAVRPRLGLPLVAWPVASFALLMVYSPLQFKHAVIMLPPLALVVGAAVGEWWRRQTSDERRQRTEDGRQPMPAWSVVRRPSSVVAAVIAVWYVASLPSVLSLDRRIVLGLPDNPPENYEDEIRLIQALTGPTDFILVDEPSVAFASRRLVPPSLVDTSDLRVRSRSLGPAEVIASSEKHDVKLLFLFSDGLREIRRFGDWVDEHYVPIKVNQRRNGKDRALYLRRDADLDAARAVLERDLEQRSGAGFGRELRLLGHSLDRGEVRPGGSVTLTLGWQATGRPSADYHVVTTVRDSSGQELEQAERALGGGRQGTAAWDAGRWVFRGYSLGLRSSAPPGDYQLSVSLYDSRLRRMLPLEGTDATELPLGTLRVRRSSQG